MVGTVARPAAVASPIGWEPQDWATTIGLIGLLPARAGGGEDRLVPPFEIDSRIAEGVHRLTVVGDLDLATTPELVRRLAEVDRTARAVEIDLGQVSFLDACGLRCLLAGQAEFERNGGPPLALTHPSRPVRRLFGLTGLSGHLPDLTSAH